MIPRISLHLLRVCLCVQVFCFRFLLKILTCDNWVGNVPLKKKLQRENNEKKVSSLLVILPQHKLNGQFKM